MEITPSESTLARATLLADPWVEIPPDLDLPVRLSRSSAGPAIGRLGALFLAFGGRHVRVNLADTARFRLESSDPGFRLLHEGRPFLEGVEIVESLLHAPNMAFINLYSGCDLDCVFCDQPQNREAKVRSVRDIVLMVREAAAQGKLGSVALTSGICVTPATTNQGLYWAALAVKEVAPDVPLGVEPYIEDPADLALLKEAGADEIKLNIQAATDEIFEIVCPGLDRDLIWANLSAAVELFGRGRVQSNLIVGLGETREQAVAAIERLAALGVIPTVRPLRLATDRRSRLTRRLGRLPELSPAYLLDLHEAQVSILDRHGLTRSMEDTVTMCISCGGCDLTPLDRS